MKIRETIGINNAKLIIGNADTELEHFSFDTRTIKEGDTFLGLKGENINGSTLYLKALELGAKTVIISDVVVKTEDLDKYKDRNVLLVQDTLTFILELAKIVREKLDIPVVAVTGSVGKTSTKNIIAGVLGSKYKVMKTSGNLNTNIGLAITLLSIRDEEVLVLEMGMTGFGEISELTNIAKPTVAVINNIGTPHIGLLGSRENILKAKLEILEGLSGPVIVNNDNDLLHDWQLKANIMQSIITFGIDTESDYRATDFSYSEKGSNFKMNGEDVYINVMGKHFIYNSLVAFAVGDIFHLDHAEIRKSLENIPLDTDRMEIINNNGITIINDSYNCSYDALVYVLDILGKFPGRTIAVLGADMAELGDFTEEITSNVGALVAKNNIDILITVGKSTTINESAIKNGLKKENVYHFMSNKEASNFINNIKKVDDTYLVKANKCCHFYEIVNEIKE